ncbi:hypothetical protein Ait01nite_011190 [Actinoplanes italicus]|uniref:Uncharacterized protein n=1 Tax=Actinoplanes italicus TaxID=113567 RepID=A0A2T0KH46_9ACTN|nr:hypothetical protein [Actinoplanes italicus]PRX22557.1 hypothetical protein CLV67_10484 [Actinoplanes italicus]GIE28074.1 hypothetical protein Ait01nite_011190 [Actinoplanes italicus]
MGVEGVRSGSRRLWWVLTAGIVVAAVAGGLIHRVVDGPGEPAIPRVPVAEGFPPVLPPSFEKPSPSATPAGPFSSIFRPAPSRRTNRPAAPVPSRTAADAAGLITAYSACSAPAGVTFTATFTEQAGYLHVFIDTDRNPATGFDVLEIEGGFGADYMIENDLLYQSTGTAWSWREVDGVRPYVSATGGTHRWLVGPAHGSGRVVFNASDGETSEERYTPVVTVAPC